MNQGVKVHPIGPAAGEEMTSEDCKQSFIRRGVSLTAPDKRFPHKIAGSANPEDLGASAERFEACLPKPVDRAALEDRLRVVLGRRVAVPPVLTP